MPHGGDIYRNNVKLDHSVNLSPLTLPDSVREAMQRGLDAAGFYPDTEQTGVRNALADADGVDADNVYAGSGASELILACVRAVNPRKVLLIRPCYSGYDHALYSLSRDAVTDSNSCRVPVSSQPEICEYFLTEENGFRLSEDITEHMDESIDLMFLTDPWNPTGLNIPDGLLRHILERALACNIQVVLDQSFLFMSDKTASGVQAKSKESPDQAEEFTPAALVAAYDNLFIIRSYTKLFALPGIRMGYIISSADNISMIRKQLPEWNLSSVASAAMEACAEVIKNTIYVHKCTSNIITEREYLIKELRSMGLKVYSSDTAFILLRSEYELYNGLLKHGILIRDCSDYKGLGKGYYRIAVRDRKSNEILVNAIRQLL